MAQYDQPFYKMLSETARRSARHIVPAVLAYIDPKSVIDIGCGTGAWLSVFAENGITDFVGVDGNFFPDEMLEIPAERYVSFDLTLPYNCDRSFDLVVSLEVAEHLPPHCGAPLVGSLVRLGPAVLFSAAIPGQGGTHHLNEQWQDYWAGLFKRHGYVALDCVRPLVWDNGEVAWWYSQNTILYCNRSYATANQALAQTLERNLALPLRIVHPRKLQEAVWRERLAHAACQLRHAIPAGAAFLLIDEATAGDAFQCCGHSIPFPQKDGVFAGDPVDSRSAISDMRSLWSSASHAVILEPAFWWLGFYPDWFNYLKSNSTAVIETETMLVFELAAIRDLPEDEGPRPQV
jgi:SAM-dependent methyltransferase